LGTCSQDRELTHAEVSVSVVKVQFSLVQVIFLNPELDCQFRLREGSNTKLDPKDGK
jgi:hypothetical protein